MRDCSSIIFFVSVIAVLWLGPTAPGAGTPHDDVVVLANRNVRDSVELARFYMDRRSIPTNNLVVLSLPAGEVISRKTYNRRLRDPLLAVLRKRGLIEQVLREPERVGQDQSAWMTTGSSVRYMVSMYGIPLRISDARSLLQRALFQEEDYRDSTTAAVDSELSLLFGKPYPIAGPLPCPLFARMQAGTGSRDNNFFVMAARLDGPDAETVRHIIDDTLWAERYGLLGRCYFDMQVAGDDSYKLGDYWIEEACERFRREGFECVLERTGALMGPAFPVSEPVVYFGWYSKHPYGPFARERFRFQRGAVAYHIHSAGGKSIRSRKRYWMGPLITLGAAATMGAVAEPYLSFTPDLAIFSDRLCRGYTFGEAAGMSMRVVSWQTALAGDPLYRPFKYTLDQQIAHLQADQRPEVVWAWIRKVNLLLRAGHFQQAVDYTRQCITERDHPVLQEKLGDLYAGNDMYEEAVTAYRQATAAGPADETMVRVGRKWVDILRQTGQDDRADEVAARIRANLGESVLLDWLEPMK